MLILNESHVFEPQIETMFEACTTIQTLFLSTALIHDFHAATSYTYICIYQHQIHMYLTIIP